MLGLRSVKREEFMERLHVCLAEDKGDMTTHDVRIVFGANPFHLYIEVWFDAQYIRRSRKGDGGISHFCMKLREMVHSK